MKEDDITEFVCTRISHDLGGNIGVLSNSLNMLAEDPSELEDILPLLQESTRNISDRLKFFRLAFGLKNAEPKEIPVLQTVIDNYLATIGNPQNPIKVILNVQNISLYKIVLLCVMALVDTFKRGGQIDVTETENGLAFHISSEFGLVQNKLQDILSFSEGKILENNPALSAPIFYLKSFLSDTDVQMKFKFQDKEADLIIS